MLADVADKSALQNGLVPSKPPLVYRMVTLQPGITGWGADPELGGTGRTPPGTVPAGYLRVGQRVIGRIGPLEYSFTVTEPPAPADQEVR